MCGIVGYIGKKNNVADVLIMGLKSLEYRGYDSAGIALFNDKEDQVIKSKGKISSLEEKLKDETLINANYGLGHTRWATHGEPSDKNAHPHQVGKVTLVHNGIIENMSFLKQKLEKKGYSFHSDTDSEVIAALLNNLYSNEKDPLKVIQEAMKLMEGSYALVIAFDGEKNKLYAVKKDSPLLIGYGEDEIFCASDVAAIINYTKKYQLLEDFDIAELSLKDVNIYNIELQKVSRIIKEASWDIKKAEKTGYDHFMLKEIMEEDRVIEDTLKPYLTNLETLTKKMPDLGKYNKIHIVACGSAMYAGMVGKYLLEEYTDISVTVEVASEYRYNKNFDDAKTLVILISQSGETADTIASMRYANSKNIDTLGIVNVSYSTIARECKIVLPTYAGLEVAVATTKAYLAQVSLLSLLAFAEGFRRKKWSTKEALLILEEYRTVPEKIRKVLNNKDEYFKWAEYINGATNTFFIGRNIDYALCLEGSLKLKEISYIHSEAYQAGELKHGTISLVDEKTPVIAILTNHSIIDKTWSNVREVKSRGAKILLVTTDEIMKEEDFHEKAITVAQTHPLVQSLLIVPTLQLMAYQIAKDRGCDIDKPKNLAKSVTVE